MAKTENHFHFHKRLESSDVAPIIIKAIIAAAVIGAGWYAYYYVTATVLPSGVLDAYASYAEGYDLTATLSGFMLLFSLELTVLVLYLFRRTLVKAFNYSYLCQLYYASKNLDFKLCPYCHGSLRSFTTTQSSDTFSHSTHENRTFENSAGDRITKNVEVKHYNRRYFNVTNYICDKCHNILLRYPPSKSESTGVVRFWSKKMRTFGFGKLIIIMVLIYVAVSAFTLINSGIIPIQF